jgi:hypothetical protein
MVSRLLRPQQSTRQALRHDAYRIVNDDKVKPAQKKQLFEASQTQPDFFAALNTKIDQLREGQAVRRGLQGFPDQERQQLP